MRGQLDSRREKQVTAETLMLCCVGPLPRAISYGCMELPNRDWHQHLDLSRAAGPEFQEARGGPACRSLSNREASVVKVARIIESLCSHLQQPLILPCTADSW